MFIEQITEEGWRDSTVGKAIALHTTDHGLITPNDLRSSLGMSTYPGGPLKQTNKKPKKTTVVPFVVQWNTM